MAYNNYRLKIGGTILNDSYIAKGSYKCEEGQRVVRSWKDANGINHEEYGSTPQAKITFSLRERNTAENATMIALLNSLNDVTVEFYNDRTNTYRTGTFKIEKMSFSHRNLGGAGVLYNTTQVTLTER